MKEIICDTNIYYYIGDSKISVQVFPDSILNSTILNILELATSRNLIDKFDFTRKAIQAAIKTGPMNPDSPFVHLAKLKDPVFTFDSVSHWKTFMNGTEMIANGHEIEKHKIGEFEKWLSEMRKPFEDSTEFIRNSCEEITKKIRDKKLHRKEDVSDLNREVVSDWVVKATNGKVNLKDFNWSKVELFDNTLHYYFQQLELGALKMQPNDWVDLFQLIYVQPGMKYFTMENRWKNIIKASGMGDYLVDFDFINSSVAVENS